MRNAPVNPMDPEVARKRWEEKFTWKEGDIQIVAFERDGVRIELTDLGAVSIRQPWAWLVVMGYKDVENRSWRTNHRGALLIHASKNQSLVSPENLAETERRYAV